MVLLAVSIASAHGTSFGTVAVSVAGDEAWAVVDGWGLVHSADGGETWAWHCEEALGGDVVYDVLALGEGRAAVASRLGVLLVDAACGWTAMPGLPEGTYATTLAEHGEVVLAGAIGPDDAGVLACDGDTCGPTDLWGPGLFPKSLVVDGDRAWATTVEEGTLAAALWTRTDGDWSRVYGWPDGDVDPHVLDADGDAVWVWARARDDAHTPAMLVSDDGGAAFTRTLEAGYYTDAAPGFVRLGDTVLVGSIYGARTWRSDDRGRTWTEVSLDTPSVRCGARAGDVAWVCADHVNDGFDLAVTGDGTAFTPVACLEEARPAACAADTCSESAWVEASALGGGECDVAAAEPPPDDESRCGCAGGAHAGMLLPLLWRRRRCSG